MQSPEQQYLEQVLGIRQFIRPEGGAVLAVCVLAGRELSGDERTLLEKMLASVQINDFSLHTTKTEIPKACGYVLLGGDEPSLPEGSLQVTIAEFDRLVRDATSPDVRHLKKQIWDELKVFKKKLET